MNCSAVLVVARPGRLDAAAEAVAQVEGVFVPQRDEDHDRLICTIEAETEREEVARFNAVSRLEPVLDASLLSHYVGLDADE